MPAPRAIDRSRRESTCRPIILHIPFEAMAAIMTPDWLAQTSPNRMRKWTSEARLGVGQTLPVPTSSSSAFPNNRVCNSASSYHVTGHINAMLWNGVIKTPRLTR